MKTKGNYVQRMIERRLNETAGRIQLLRNAQKFVLLSRKSQVYRRGSSYMEAIIIIIIQISHSLLSVTLF